MYFIKNNNNTRLYFHERSHVWAARCSLTYGGDPGKTDSLTKGREGMTGCMEGVERRGNEGEERRVYTETLAPYCEMSWSLTVWYFIHVTTQRKAFQVIHLSCTKTKVCPYHDFQIRVGWSEGLHVCSSLGLNTAVRRNNTTGDDFANCKIIFAKRDDIHTEWTVGNMNTKYTSLYVIRYATNCFNLITWYCCHYG